MNYIYDKNNLIDVIDSFPEQIMEAYEYSLNIKISNFPESIFICGMGGSGIAGKILEQYTASAGLKIPVYCVNDYEIPSFCKSNSLFIICSYSGNTEESISCYKQAIKLSDNMQRIIVVASDGKLKEYAENNKNSLIVLPKGLQPRNAIAYLFFPILKVLEKNNLIERQERYVRELIEYLKKNNKKLHSESEKIANQLLGKIPIIYSSSRFYPVAYRWKTQFNENSKTSSYCNVFPELDHNEINGFKNSEFPLHLIFIRDEEDHKRVQKRMSITKNLIKSENPKITFTELSLKGNNLLTRMFSCIYLGDLTSFYLAMKYSTDPTPVEIIEKLKKELGHYLN